MTGFALLINLVENISFLLFYSKITDPGLILTRIMVALIVIYGAYYFESIKKNDFMKLL